MNILFTLLDEMPLNFECKTMLFEIKIKTSKKGTEVVKKNFKNRRYLNLDQNEYSHVILWLKKKHTIKFCLIRKTSV